jgi:hypothetical protein
MMKEPLPLSNTIYLQGITDVSVLRLQILASAGEDPVIFKDLEQVLNHIVLLGDNARPTVIVDACGGESELSSRIVEVTSCSKVRHLPIVLLGPNADTKAAQLKRQLPCVSGIDSASGQKSILFGLAKIASLVAGKRGSPAKPPPVREELSSVILDPRAMPLGRGGPQFALLDRVDFVDDSRFVCSHPRRDKILLALDEISSSSEILGLRSRRTAGLSAAIGTRLGLQADQLESIETAALLLPWAFKDDNGLMNHDLFLLPDNSATSRLGEALKASANFLREAVADEDAAHALEEMSQAISQSHFPPNSSLAAHCVLGAELADRSSWAGTRWNRYGVKRAQRKLSSGESFPLNESVATNIALSLTESSGVRLLISPEPALVYERSNELNQKLHSEALEEANALFEGKNLSDCSLSELKAGMLLAKPFVSLDGILLLRSNTRIDKNLISALQRLAVVRPLPETASVAGA